MNTTHSLSSPDINAHLPPTFLHRPTVLGRRISIATAQSYFPGFGGLLQSLEAVAHKKEYGCLTYGCVLRNSQLTWDSRIPASGSTLLLRIPDEFEPDLERLAAMEPDTFTMHTTDLTCALDYVGWSVADGGVKRTVMVCNRALQVVIEDCRGPGYTGSLEPPPIVVPVILMTRHSLIVGGFWVDSSWDVSASGMTMSKHYRLYSEDELAAALQEARRVGLTPWQGKWWRDSDGSITIEASVYDWREPLGLCVPDEPAVDNGEPPVY